MIIVDGAKAEKFSFLSVIKSFKYIRFVYVPDKLHDMRRQFFPGFYHIFSVQITGN